MSRNFTSTVALQIILFIRPMQASGMRVASPSRPYLCHRFQQLPLGAFDEEVAVRDLRRGQ